MYADYFGFREPPFTNTPDPRFFYSTPDHEEAVASLIYSVRERKGFVLLTGEAGTGKTLVTRLVLRRFGDRIAFANLHDAMQGPRDLMESICAEFDIPFDASASHARLVHLFQDYLLEQFSRNTPVILVVDEAQNLPVDAFEQLRLVGNLEADDAKLLQVAIVGQPELQQLFRSPPLRPFRQRLFRSFHLPALSREHTEGYIRHRLRIAADRDMEIFDTAALNTIHRMSRGLPRIINTICDNALLSAYSAGRRTIDGPFLESVLAHVGLIEDDVTHRGPAKERQPAAIPDPKPVRRAVATSSEKDPTPDGDALPGAIREPRTMDMARSLVSEHAHQAVARAEKAALNLAAREEKLHRLARSIKAMLQNLTALFDRAQATATRTGLAEREARATGDRLIAQTQRSRRLLEQLVRLDRLMNTPLAARSLTAAIPPSPTLRATFISERERLSAGTSLAPKQHSPMGDGSRRLDTHAARLARDVGELAEFVAADRSTTALSAIGVP